MSGELSIAMVVPPADGAKSLILSATSVGELLAGGLESQGWSLRTHSRIPQAPQLGQVIRIGRCLFSIRQYFSANLKSLPVGAYIGTAQRLGPAKNTLERNPLDL